jgi:hypothetical protein
VRARRAPAAHGADGRVVRKVARRVDCDHSSSRDHLLLAAALLQGRRFAGMITSRFMTGNGGDLHFVPVESR